MSWPIVALKDETSVITKGTTPTSLGHAFTDAGVPFLRAQNLVDGTVSVSADPLFISTTTNEALKRSKICPNDVLISIAGTIGRAAIVPPDAEEMNCNQAVAIVRPSARIDRRFLLHWLSSNDALSQVSNAKVTGVISNLSLGQIGLLKIPLPPLEEQKRIAEILDQADVLRRLRTRALDKINTLGQAIFYEMFGDDLRSGTKKPLSELIDVRSSLDDPKLPQNSGLPHVGPEHITPASGRIDWNNVRTCKDDGVISGKYRFEDGDVIFSKIRPYLNKVAIADRVGMCSADMYALHAPNGTLSSGLLHFILGSNDFLAYAETVSNRANIPKMNRSQLLAYETVVPEISKQLEFEQSLRTVEGERINATLHATRCETLFNALQHRAFRGEL